MYDLFEIITNNFIVFVGKQPVRYSIVSGDPDRNFAIEPMSGAIRTDSQLDRETKSSYLLNVRATNGNAASYDQTQVCSPSCTF